MTTITTTDTQDAAVRNGALSLQLTSEQIAVIRGPIVQPPPVSNWIPPKEIEGHRVHRYNCSVDPQRTDLGEIGDSIIAVKVVAPTSGPLSGVIGNAVSFLPFAGGQGNPVASAVTTDGKITWGQAVTILNGPPNAWYLFRWNARRPVIGPDSHAAIKVQVAR